MTETRRSSWLLWGCAIVALCAIAFSVATSGDIRVDIDEGLRIWSQDKTVVVTGANAGLGLATVLRIARAGTAKIIVLACRNPSKCKIAVKQAQEALPENSTTGVHGVTLDLANRESIVQGAHSIQQVLSDEANQTPPLDVLINNAGVAYAWNTKEFVEGVETHMAINYLGHFLLTHRLWPNLLAAVSANKEKEDTTPPRVVQLSSLMANSSWRDASLGWKDPNPINHGKWYNLVDCIRFYSQSKRANLMKAWELHNRYETVDSVAAHPGYARTEIFWNIGNDLITTSIRERLANFKLMSMSSHDGAAMQLIAAFAPPDVVPSGSYVVPKYLSKGSPILIPSILTRFSLHYKSFTEKDSASLWDASLKELGIEEFGKV